MNCPKGEKPDTFGGRKTQVQSLDQQANPLGTCVYIYTCIVYLHVFT